MYPYGVSNTAIRLYGYTATHPPRQALRQAIHRRTRGGSHSNIRCLASRGPAPGRCWIADASQLSATVCLYAGCLRQGRVVSPWCDSICKHTVYASLLSMLYDAGGECRDDGRDDGHDDGDDDYNDDNDDNDDTIPQLAGDAAEMSIVGTSSRSLVFFLSCLAVSPHIIDLVTDRW
ncbi:predicted protein [Histoplasma capsulatum G186AR]|uniref:Uncharacterized protein n=1 Tax=Ajellomyces capsulatus (strain G186AR / H82 / ATCC MYA-2454 / RMSCC 2432) TaxID=447093 RepID=C0P094_AJECG|nr:uncharacterized protein HCBG_08813 [Histoplasma capsulatum G186AR]EEH02910.1 predicted protein [Histoplasma capsulatum G186AR]